MDAASAGESPARDDLSAAQPEVNAPSPVAGEQEEISNRVMGTASARKKKSRRRKILTPIVLAVLGFGLIGISILILPSRKGVEITAYPSLIIGTSEDLASISYSVQPFRSSITAITISIEINSLSKDFPAAGSFTAAEFIPPNGITFQICPRDYCERISRVQYIWRAPLIANKHGMATETFFVHASNFGYASNGVTESAILPEIRYGGLGTPQVQIHYYGISDPASYDWSDLPTAFAASNRATWAEIVSPGDTPAKVATGTNHSNETHDNFMIFLAGALIGLGGGAVLSSVQEALHANDD
jgi:hypothetical protein